MWLLTSIGLAAPSEYNFVEENENCLYYTGPVQKSGALPIWAECHWKEISLERLDSFLKDIEGQTKSYSSVSDTKILERSKNKIIFWQVHTDPRMSPREGRIICVREMTDKNITHRWWLSENQQSPTDDNLLIEEHSGSWTLEEHPDGGVKLRYESLYLPGGNIPAWIVRQFQTSAVIQMLEETYQTVKSK
jgi:hypothetical protein